MSSFLNNSQNVALEVPELALDGMWGMLHSYFANPQPLEIEKDDSTLQEVDSQKSDTIEKQGMLMDTLSEFYKLYIEVEENDDSHQDTIIKDMEKSVSKTCNSVGKSLEAYYQRIAKAYNHILKSRFSNGFNALKPSINIYDISRPMKEIATAPWKIKELPGRSPLSQWPSALGDLNERLMKLEPMSAWSEPLFSEDGKDIFEQAEEFIRRTVSLKDNEKSKKTDEILLAALSALIGLSVLSADYTKILSTLSIIYEISEKYQDADKIVSKLAKTMKHYINQLKSMHNDTKSYHHLAQGSFYGCIALPKEAEADYQVEATSSLTTDGTYLYLYWCSGRGGMFKIGTGEGNSLAGKVYLHVKTELTGSLQWVYLNNKIYARKVDESLGVLTLISPDNFLTLGTVSLQCDDKELFNNAASSRINKSYPLLTDGTYIFIVLLIHSHYQLYPSH